MWAGRLREAAGRGKAVCTRRTRAGAGERALRAAAVFGVVAGDRGRLVKGGPVARTKKTPAGSSRRRREPVKAG
jgi:hypothetical protein